YRQPMKLTAFQVAPQVNLFIIGIMLAGSLLKAVFMVVCYKRGSASSKVSLAYVFLSEFLHFSGLIAVSWFHNALEYVPILVGVRGERDQLSRILKVVIEHDDRIRFIDHLMVYHTGIRATVELHIVLDENLPLKVGQAF
ncbi:hypothetical protein GCK32_020467, partial [Trichostrongylus colubriformis]